LGAVRARHNDIQRIEQTLGELSLLFTQLNEVVIYQEAPVQQIEQQTEHVKTDTEAANNQLTAVLNLLETRGSSSGGLWACSSSSLLSSR
jgi:t-SNARE complex subunit (syntaxin)